MNPQQFRGATFTVNAQDYIRMMYSLLTSETDVAHLPGLIQAFAERQKKVIQQVIEREYGGLTSDFSTGMMYSVLCFDAHTPQSWNEWQEAAAPYPPALAGIEYFLQPCSDWHTERASEQVRTPYRSTIPSLVITGGVDPMNLR